MSSIKPKPLPNVTNVRIPEELQDTIRKQALKSERTFSGQIRWLLQRAVEAEEKRVSE